MRLINPGALIYVPDGRGVEAALARTTHLAVGAHPDDIPIMAEHGIHQCFGTSERWFLGITLTDGAGSPRSGPFADFTDDRMRTIRTEEEKRAATVGEYAAVVLLGYPSSAVKDPSDERPTSDLAALIDAARPEVVYTHNPADRHDTHVATVLRAIAAVHSLPADDRPRRLYGCEVWGDLDWLTDDDKVVLDVSGHDHLSEALLGVYDSQIAGGKRYDLAVMGRRRAHATFSESQAVDRSTALTYAMDLTPLLDDPGADVEAHVVARIERMRQEVSRRIAALRGG